MVRRRTTAGPEDALPVWVMRFIESDWNGADVMLRWREWQTSVREYLEAEQLKHRDPSLWLKVHANHRRVGTALRTKNTTGERP